MIQISSGEFHGQKQQQQLENDWHGVLGRTEVGFPRICDQDGDWKAIADRVAKVRPARHTLVLGIGGSSLGTQVIYQAFKHKSEMRMHFLESPDPHLWAGLGEMKGDEWRDKHVIIVSKSGNTLETLSWIEHLNMSEPGWMKTSQVTVIASPGEGPLQRWAAKENIPCLWIPAVVGGRFSVLTAVGMFPAALMGLNIGEFRTGAKWALENPRFATSLSAQVLESWKRGEWITQMWTYSESLRLFGEWWVQLWGESLGKLKTRLGAEAPRVSTPMACTGPRDQHSLVQQLMEGARDKFVIINRVKSVELPADPFGGRVFEGMPFSGRSVSLGQIIGAQASAFEQSLKEVGISNSVIRVDEVSERSLGALFMMWQMCIAILGEHLAIDAFNQPGVELGKKYAAKLL